MGNNFLLLLPEFLVTGLAFAVLTLDFVLRRERKHLLGYVSAIGLVAILMAALAQLWSTKDDLYDGLLVVDGYALFFKAFFLGLGAVVVLASVEYVPPPSRSSGRVLRNRAVQRGGHDAAGDVGRVADGLHRVGASQLLAVRPGLIRPVQPQIQRRRHQVHTARRAFLRAAVVRHKPGVRAAGNDQLRRNQRGAGGVPRT